LFLPVQKDGVIVSRRLTEGAIYKILEATGAGRGCSPLLAA